MNNPLKIYSGSNTLLYTTPVNTGCRRKVQLMSEDSITVKFSDKDRMVFPVGSRIEDYYATEEQQGKYNANTDGYDYELKFHAYYWRWANKLLFYQMAGVDDAPKETSFSLTASIEVHASIILRALNALGFTYNNSPFRVDTDSDVTNEAKYISYSNTSILGGIQAIAEEYECEWWVESNAIHFGKCHALGEYDFTVGDNVSAITPSDTSTKANRLYVYGSDRNLPSDYRATSGSDVVGTIVTRRLMLPAGTPYLQTASNIPEDQIIEGEVVFDSVYPRTQLTVSAVATYTSQATDGAEQTFYRITYGNSFPFLKEYILQDQELHIVFESGALNGMDFAVKFNPLGENEKFPDDTINDRSQMFEIVVNADYGRELPDLVLHPEAGDRFILYGWDPTKMEGLGLIANAERELLAEGLKEVEERKKDLSTYTCPMMWDWCKEKGAANSMPQLGSTVTLHFSAGDTGRQSRVIGFEHDLDIEYANVTYTCGEKVSASRLKTLESKVEGLTHSGEKVKMQNSLDFLSKRYSDRTPFQLASDLGFEIGNYLAGVSGGMFGIDKADGQSFAEMEKLFVRGKAYFETLTIIEANTLAGKQYITPGGSIKCTGVGVNELVNVVKERPKTDEQGNAVLDADGNPVMEKYTEQEDNGIPEGVYRCYFLSEQDGEKTECKFVVGDQAISEMFNAKTGTDNKVSNHRYWRHVDAVNNDAYADDAGNHYGYIDLSDIDCLTGSDVPKEGDVIEQFGNRMDVSRQGAMVFSTVDSDSPSIKMLTGIGSGETNAEHYSLDGRDIISQGYDPVKGQAYMKCHGSTYVGPIDESTYVKYTPENGVEIKGKLSVESTVGDQTIEEYVKETSTAAEKEEIEKYVNEALKGVQEQIDGAIETWFYEGEPTLANYPASEWDTDELERHLGDLYYDTETGTAYKFTQDAEGAYCWKAVTDASITKALEAAKNAQDTADNKRRIFTKRPEDKDAYDEGDLWVNATYGTQYNNDMLRCIKGKAAGEAFDIDHWMLASKYTDNTALNAFVAEYEKSIEDIKEQVDGKAETWYQATDPSITSRPNGWYGETDAEHKGDLWYRTTDCTTWYWNGDEWEAQDVPAAVFDAIDGKAEIFVSKPTEGYNVNDLWFLEDSYELSDGLQKKGTLVVAISDMKGSWSGDDWAKKDVYTDDTLAQAAIDRFAAWSDDGVFSPTEIKELEQERERIDSDKTSFDNRYGIFSGAGDSDTNLADAKSAYDTAYTAYRNEISAVMAATPDEDGCVAIPDGFKSKMQLYYNVRAQYDYTLTFALKKYSELMADQYSYLKTALGDVSTTLGGVFLTSVIRLGEHNDDLSTQTVWSGLNGVRENANNRDISYWAGGDMIDLFNDDDTRKDLSAGVRPAASVIRMDGSAYFSAGLVGFKSNGGGWLAGDNITWDSNGAITFGNGIKIDLGGESSTTLGGIQSSLTSVTELLNKFSNLFTPYLGTVKKTWADVTKSGDYDSVRINAGAWTESFLSAKGQNDSETSGGGATQLRMLSDVSINDSSLLVGQALIYNGEAWVNGSAGLNEIQLAEYLTSNSYAKKSDIPSLTGYATQTWVESQNYLTSHQTIRTLTIQKNGTAVGTFTPTGASDTTLNIADVASAATLSSHTGNGTIHITSAERTKWNKVVTDFAAITGTDSDTIINKWEEVIAFLDTYTEADTLAGLLSNKVDKEDGKGLSTNDFTDALLTKLNGIEAGANKYTHPTGTARQISAATGKVLSAITVDTLGHVTSATAKTLVAGDIPSLDWSKITSGKPTTLSGYGITDGVNALTVSGSGNAVTTATVSGHTLTLTKGATYLPQSTFDDLFEKVNIGTTASPVYAIKAKYGLYSTSFISAMGLNSSGGGGGSYTRLDSWSDYSTDTEGYVLSAKLGYDLYLNKADKTTTTALDTRITALEGKNYLDALTLATSGSGNAVTAVTLSTDKKTLTVTKGATFLTSHQSVSNKAATLAWGTTSTVATVGSTNITVALPANPNTDTKNTAGSTDTSSKIYLIGATSQAANPQTYSHDTAYVGTDGCLYSGGVKVLTSHQSLSNYVTLSTAQTISGAKTFSSAVTASSFVKSGGTSSQFLKADGSVDSSTYLTTGTAASTYVTSLGTSGNYLTWVKNGVTTNVTVPFATRASGLNIHSYVKDINDTLSENGIYPWMLGSANSPGNYGSMLQWSNVSSPTSGTAAHWITQLASVTENGGLYYRTQTNTSEWSAWEKILTDSNYTSTLDSRYYTESEIDTKLTNGSVTKLGTSTVGSSVKPIYLSGGTATACSYAFGNASGNVPISNRTLNTNLNADLLDGRHAGTRNGDIAMFVEFPGYNSMISLGYLDSSYTTDGHPTELYFKALVKWAVATYPNGGCLMGKANPNSSGFCRIHLYNSGTGSDGSGGTSNGAESTNPRYCSGEYLNYPQNFYTFGTMDGVWKWCVGTYNGNALTATTLQTARSIWGQSFNGSASISGGMTGVSNIYNSSSAAPYLQQASVPTGAGALGTAIGFGTAPTQYGLFVWGDGSGIGHIQVGRKDGTATAYNLKLQEFGGKVLVGTTTNSYALNTASFICDSWVRTKSTTGWYNETYGGGMYMTDSTWVKIYNGKSFYAGSGTIRTDGAIQVGESGSKFHVTSDGSVSTAGDLTVAGTVSANVLSSLSDLHVSGDLTVAGDVSGDSGCFGAIYLHQNDEINRFGGALYLQYRGNGLSGYGTTGNIVMCANGGNVGIGTSSPSYSLHVNGSIKAVGASYLDGNVYQKAYNFYQRSTKGIYQGVDNDGNFSICFHESGTYTKIGFYLYYADQRCEFEGAVRSKTGVWSDGYVSARGQNTSDIRLKTDIADFNATSIIKSLNPVSFKWNDVARNKFKALDTDLTQFGLVAQDTAKSNPWLVEHNMFGDDYMGVRYEKLIPVLLKGEIEIIKQTENLNLRVKRLEEENKKLKEQIFELQTK